MTQGLCPKLPNGTQKRGKRGEEQHGAARGTQNQKAPDLSVRPVQQKAKGGAAHAEAVAAVQPGGQMGKAQPEGAQQIIDHTGGQSQQNGLEKQPQRTTPRHCLSEQAAEKTAAPCAVILVGQGVDAAVYMQLPAVQ